MTKVSMNFMNYDVIIVGAGPGGIFAAYELMQLKPELKVGVFESGHRLEQRRCPIDGKKIKSCIKCPTCSIMRGFGGAGAFSDGKYNITNDFGGSLNESASRMTSIFSMPLSDTLVQISIMLFLKTCTITSKIRLISILIPM